MANRIRGITIEINGNTQKLSTALAQVNSAADKTTRSLKDINNALKFNPNSSVLLKQKQEELGKAIDNTKAKLKAEWEQLLRLNQQPPTDKNKEAQDVLQREIAETEGKLKQLEQELKNFGTVGAQQAAIVGEKMKQAGEKAARVGRTLTTYVTMPIAAGAGAAVKEYGAVDRTMTLTNKTMGSTKKEAQQLNMAMKDAAIQSTFGMEDAATATLNFARAGLDATEASQTLAPAMNLAAGEGGNLDTVSAALVSTIHAFKGDFADAEHYADVFAAACNNSQLDIDSLSESMKVAGPTFKAAGYDVQDAALYLGVMADKGIPANEAANALKTGMANLAKPTKEAAGYMEKLGISMFDENGKAKDTVTLQKELHDAFQGLSDKEKMAAASAIFGKRQMSKWLALIQTAPEDVEDLNKSIEGSSGLTQEMADTMMSGFGGSLLKLKSTLDVLKETIGEVLSGPLSGVVTKITEWADKFIHADESTQKFILAIAGVVAAIGPVLLVGGKITRGVGKILENGPKIVNAAKSVLSVGKTVANGAKALWGILAANPIILIIAAVAALVAGFIYLWKHCEGFRNFWINLWEKIKAAASTAIESIKETINSIKETWAAFKEFISELWDAIKQKVSDAIQNVKTTIETTINNIKTFWTNVWEGVKTALETVWNAITGFIQRVIDGWKLIITTVLNAIKTFWTNVWNGIKFVFETIWNAITSFIQRVINGWKKIISTAMELIRKYIVNPISNAKDRVLRLFEDIKEGIRTKIDAAKEFVRKAIEKIKSFFKFKWSLPDLKLPHITVGSYIDVPVLGTIPDPRTLHVDWYRKAYDQIIGFNRPTVLATASGYKGFGDGHGAEFVMGENKLREIAGDTINVTINVAAQPGQNVNELANIIEAKLTQNVRRAQRVYS